MILKFNRERIVGIKWDLLFLQLMQAIGSSGLSKMNISRKPVSAQPRGYDDPASRINVFRGAATHCQNSECVRLEAVQEGANINTEIEVLSWNRSILGAAVAERVYHRFASRTAQDNSNLSKSDAAYAVSNFMLRYLDSNKSFNGG